jgi:hypothetical protein
VDFKIVPTPVAPVSRSGLHRQRSALRERITAALQAAGFAVDPKDPAQARSRDESSYTGRWCTWRIEGEMTPAWAA